MKGFPPMTTRDKAVILIVTVVGLIALAVSIIWMHAWSKKPSDSQSIHPAPTPRALPYKAQAPTPEPQASPSRKVAQRAQSAQVEAGPEPDTAWHYGGETVPARVKDDGEVEWYTIPEGLKAIRTTLSVPDCHSYPSRFAPCRTGEYLISICQKEVSGPPPNGSDFIKSHHEPDPSCEFDRARGQ